ncbi:MAG: tRNA pseudouridine(38-40) synthase TruA [Phycisphaerae bacterium]
MSNLRTIYLLVAYDGSEFHGWQHQPGLRTVQGVLAEAVRRAVRHDVDLVGSGRTDAGVHASGQVASFVTSCQLPATRLRYAVNSRLPTDLAVLSALEVHPEFHATRSAVSKLYRYRVHYAGTGPVAYRMQRYAYHCWKDLDLERMQAAARHFIRETDFSAMAGRGAERVSPVRTVLRCDVERHLDEVRINVEGTGFLYRQVRNMVGTLFNVGLGRWEPDRVPAILASRDRANAGPTMPAHGLCLQWVRYPHHLLAVPGGEGCGSDPAGTRESAYVEADDPTTTPRR